MPDVLNWIGVQNGSMAIAYFVPSIETGIVEPSNATSTDGN
jgi:hypothetical protein